MTLVIFPYLTSVWQPCTTHVFHISKLHYPYNFSQPVSDTGKDTSRVFYTLTRIQFINFMTAYWQDTGPLLSQTQTPSKGGDPGLASVQSLTEDHPQLYEVLLTLIYWFAGPSVQMFHEKTSISLISGSAYTSDLLNSLSRVLVSTGLEKHECLSLYTGGLHAASWASLWINS